jgi:hypothetical protein
MSPDGSAFPHLRQLEVDFVIPRKVGDLPLCINPFLLYKSRDSALRSQHGTMTEHFKNGINAIERGEGDEPNEY